ncbi:MAG TPA: SMC-Scp complex subunit ScpB [Chthoniobacterales bacterium]|jgi:segregation and condensation protein B|nr:SMC-Scp complex subunit ScpB [Chthoniobacterales bacterium]
MVTLKAVVEALLFSSQKPLTPKEILQVLRLGTEYAGEEEAAALAQVTEKSVQETLQELASEYSELGRSFQLVEQVSGWQLSTRPDYQIWVRQLFPELRPTRLSPPALETLAIVAYRQPITKGDIEAIRGVTVDGVMQKLLDLGLVKIAGRAEIPGRPLLYETTQHFMEHFGLRNLNELPNASELRNLALPTATVAAEPQSDQATETPGAAESPESTPADIRDPDAETDSKIAFAPDQTDHQLNSTDGE